MKKIKSIKIENEKTVKNQKGITLVALVVTIVVLLILAGITINILFSDNGIIKRAEDAANAVNRAEEETNKALGNLADQMAQALGEDVSGLAKFIKSKEGKTGDDAYVTVAEGNQKLEDKNKKKIVIPVGFKIASDSATEVDKGIVIEDASHNQFVWVPVPDDKFEKMFGTASDKNVGKLYNLQSSNSIENPNSASSSYKEPNVLTDPTYGDAASGDATKGIEQLKSVVEIAGTDDATVLANWKTELQNKFDEMKDSVQEYKGFYIGRYEASNLSNSNNTSIPKVVKGVMPSASVNWYYMYKELQNIEKENKENGKVNEDVKTSMMWGCQWDRTLIWLVESGGKTLSDLKNSTKWGNYKDATIEYTKEDGTTKETKSNTTSRLIPTGSTEYTKANNIYDLAGNLDEWTLEALSTSARVSRGGNFGLSGSSIPASHRYGGTPYGNGVGTRPTLYVLSPEH